MWTKGELADGYRRQAVEMATAMAKLWDMHELFECMSESAGDNADPQYSLETALLHLGKALADTVTYASEYKEEAEKENKTKKQGGTKDGN